MKSPPQMPQRAMVRIWVASLHQKTSTYESTLRFLFCDRAKLIGRVDSNSCGDVVEDGAKTAPMDRQVHRGCCYTIILLTLTFS